MNPPNIASPPDTAPARSTGDDLASWQAHLDRELNAVVTQPDHPRAGDFDVDDAPELPWLDRWPRLREVLHHQREVLLPVWRPADDSALAHQKRHRRLARVTIIAGTSAIVLAILQMAVARQVPTLGSLALAVEVLAVTAGTMAVGMGLWTRGDRKWLCERNRAERLRVLKFESLGWASLWASDLAEWKHQVEGRVQELSVPLSMDKVWEWAEHEPARATEPLARSVAGEDSVLAALGEYYRVKRLAFQAAYFENRKVRHTKAARPWRHLSRPVFFTSTAFVLLHFLAGGLKHRAESRGVMASGQVWDAIEIWSLALAAIIPVLGLGCRVWLGAFEPHRSANLFACKHRAVGDLLQRLVQARTTPQAWAGAVGEAEIFFRNEHQEWLRLMLETEWML